MSIEIEYDNNGYKVAAIVDDVTVYEHPALDVAPVHIREYTGWNTGGVVLTCCQNYSGAVNQKVVRH